MNDFTPDTLRVGVPFPVGEQPDEQDWYDAHAAAWEAEVRELQARIEALENPGFQAAVAAGLADLGWQRVQVYTEW